MKSIDTLLRRLEREASAPSTGEAGALVQARSDDVARLTDGQMRTLAALRPSPLLAAVDLAVNGGAIPVRRENGAIEGGFRQIPEEAFGRGAEQLLAELDLRIMAAKQAMEAAPRDVVGDWLDLLAAQTSSRKDASALNGDLEAIKATTLLPACCFTPETLVAVRTRRDPRTNERTPWMPSYAEMEPILEGFKAEGWKRLKSLEAIKRALTRQQASRQALLEAPVGPPQRAEGEVEAWVAREEALAPSWQRVVAARSYLDRLAREAPALADRYRDRLLAMAEPQEPPTAPAGRPVVVLPPDVAAARAAAQQAASAAFRARNPLVQRAMAEREGGR